MKKSIIQEKQFVTVFVEKKKEHKKSPKYILLYKFYKNKISHSYSLGFINPHFFYLYSYIKE
jgi:hypothetical protein